MTSIIHIIVTGFLLVILFYPFSWHSGKRDAYRIVFFLGIFFIITHIVLSNSAAERIIELFCFIKFLFGLFYLPFKNTNGGIQLSDGERIILWAPALHHEFVGFANLIAVPGTMYITNERIIFCKYTEKLYREKMCCDEKGNVIKEPQLSFSEQMAEAFSFLLWRFLYTRATRLDFEYKFGNPAEFCFSGGGLFSKTEFEELKIETNNEIYTFGMPNRKHEISESIKGLATK